VERLAKSATLFCLKYLPGIMALGKKRCFGMAVSIYGVADLTSS